MRRPRRWAIVGGIAVLATVYVAYVLVERVSGHGIAYFADSTVYLQTAREPLSLEHFIYPKPFFVPAIFRLLDAQPDAIARFQIASGAIAWGALALAIAATARHHRTRIAGVLICVGFLFAPTRVGFASAILSESINDSLMVLALAFGIVLRAVAARMADGRRRTVACWMTAGMLALVIFAWQFTRDTNVIASILALLIGAWLWRIDRAWRRDRWALALAGVVVIAGGIAWWCASAQPPKFQMASFNTAWSETQPRSTYPMLNNVLVRALPDPEMRAYFVEHGLPQADELERSEGYDFVTDAHFSPARAWVATKGRSVYLCWLVTHPVASTTEMLEHTWDILTPLLDPYMPPGWIPRPLGFVDWLTKTSRSKAVIVVLLLVAPLCMWRPRAGVLTGIALVMVASGFVGAAASFFGDAVEIPRHCYGAGQQILLGLWLAVLARLDQRHAPTENSV